MNFVRLFYKNIKSLNNEMPFEIEDDVRKYYEFSGISKSILNLEDGMTTRENNKSAGNPKPLCR